MNGEKDALTFFFAYHLGNIFTMSRLDPGLLHSRGFKPGSIVRLKMKNFLTYDECEFFTGPRLNIVIGPNGTGKSALTHAICLACCGSTGDVGKSLLFSYFFINIVLKRRF